MTETIETNRMLGRKFFAEQDRMRGGPDRELLAAGYTVQINGNPALDVAGHEGFAQSFYAGVPDLKHDVEAVIADADHVVVRFVLRGTHTGLLFGQIPATGKSIAVACHAILHISHGKVARIQGVMDELSMLRQLGVIPS